MAYVNNKLKQKLHKLTREELIKRDAMAFAELLLGCQAPDIINTQSLPEAANLLT